MLNLVHNIRSIQKRWDRGRTVRLCNWSRTKGWYVVCAVMKAANLRGPHAQRPSARLRHQGRRLQRAAEHSPAVVRACPALDHLHLRRCYGTGETPTGGAHVAVTGMQMPVQSESFLQPPGHVCCPRILFGASLKTWRKW